MALRVPLFDANANGGTYVNGVAYDHETRRGVVDMHARLQANGINPSLRMAARMTGASYSFVSKIIECTLRQRRLNQLGASSGTLLVICSPADCVAELGPK